MREARGDGSREGSLRRSVDVLNMVLLLPPAPADLVLVGRAFATLSARSAAALRRMAVLGPPGGVGDDGRMVEEPVEGAAPSGEVARGDDYQMNLLADNP